MAEPSDSTKDAGLLNSENNSSKGESNQVCPQKDTTRIMKRPREEASEPGTKANEDSEPEEKRPSFRLNPPTLIHGQAKSVPKEEEEIVDSSSRRNFLRPSILSAPATTTLISSPVTSSPVNGKSVPTVSQPPLLGSSLLRSGQVPSNNPFLRTAEPEEDNEKQEFLFQSTIEEERIKENGTEATSGDPPAFDTVNGTKENVFLQMSKDSSSAIGDKAAESESSGFVFGKKMEDRVVKNEADSTSIDAAENEKAEDNRQFLFGKNLSNRVKVSGPDSTNAMFSTTPAESLIFSETLNPSSSDGVSSSTCHRKLEEDAAALFAASNTIPVIPEVEVVTGEEDEKNVLQILCKLFQYNSTTQAWTEKGRGHLRLNDKRLAASDQIFQSRLVMRVHGSLRLVLNTKIWDSMIIDRASQKSVRISAQNEDGDIGVYVIMATVNDAEQMYRALEYRVLRLKQIEEKQKSSENQNEPSSSQTTDTESISSSLPSDQTETSACKVSPNIPEEALAAEEEDEAEVEETRVESRKQENEGTSAAGEDCGAGEPTQSSQDDARSSQPSQEAEANATNISEEKRNVEEN